MNLPTWALCRQNDGVTTVYAEERGIWHVQEREEGAEVVTLCEQRLTEATILERDAEPKPMCHRCRERRQGV